MQQEKIVKVCNLTKIYSSEFSKVSALNAVNLEIKKGDFVAIMGPSGSGKSTLMHLLGCLDKPTSGQYYLNSNDISSYTDKQLSLVRATQIGFVFQSYNLIPQLNLMENVSIPFVYSSDKYTKIQITEALNQVGLGHRLNHLPRQLSGGEMQRAAIARALATSPSLILADEPTGNLDHQNGIAILKLFQNLNAQGVTIVLVTHDEFVAKHCQRIIRMMDGKIIGEESPWQ